LQLCQNMSCALAHALFGRIVASRQGLHPHKNTVVNPGAFVSMVVLIVCGRSHVFPV